MLRLFLESAKQRRPVTGAAENIPEVLLKLEQVEAQTGMKKIYIYREMEKGAFSCRYKIGSGSRWHQSDIQKWIASKRHHN
ncbi:AlpA family phage regulatory protein [Stenotrophomonas sp. ZAC14D2_NAIMI4_6]|uniref:helix-turn-helix transcriptional regulator n=1 Tax=Stenotrophomonas sp. ZAC14D2_NAIMI4_6 TaxID=2072406 RepID=UPI00131F3D3C|nr:AlpA family phage regulatory protein [Stenotrophomonas sp. ZAC14D2_NAIMI4_6]